MQSQIQGLKRAAQANNRNKTRSVLTHAQNAKHNSQTYIQVPGGAHQNLLVHQENYEEQKTKQSLAPQMSTPAQGQQVRGVSAQKQRRNKPQQTSSTQSDQPYNAQLNNIQTQQEMGNTEITQKKRPISKTSIDRYTTPVPQVSQNNLLIQSQKSNFINNFLNPTNQTPVNYSTESQAIVNAIKQVNKSQNNLTNENLNKAYSGGPIRVPKGYFNSHQDPIVASVRVPLSQSQTNPLNKQQSNSESRASQSYGEYQKIQANNVKKINRPPSSTQKAYDQFINQHGLLSSGIQLPQVPLQPAPINRNEAIKKAITRQSQQNLSQTRQKGSSSQANIPSSISAIGTHGHQTYERGELDLNDSFQLTGIEEIHKIFVFQFKQQNKLLTKTESEHAHTQNKFQIKGNLLLPEFEIDL